MNSGWHCPTFALEVAQISDLGMRRLNNQDSARGRRHRRRSQWASRGHLMMVADGMGAHAAGELASKLAADNIPHTYFKLRDLYPPAALRQAIREVNALIYNKGQSSIGFQGMGTTCSCLVLLPQGRSWPMSAIAASIAFADIGSPSSRSITASSGRWPPPVRWPRRMCPPTSPRT